MIFRDLDTLILLFGLAVAVTIIDAILGAMDKRQFIPWVNLLGLITVLGIVLDHVYRFVLSLKTFLHHF